MGKDLKGKELGEGLSQRKNGTYQARYVDRFGVRKSLYNKDIRELKKQLTQAKYEDENNLSIINSSTTLDQWFEKWMMVYKKPVIRRNTELRYIYIYRDFISPVLGMFQLSEITQLQIKGLINKLNDRGYGYETQSKVRILLTDMFNRAMEDNFVLRNPAKSVRISKYKPNNHDRRVLTREEQALFFDCASGTFYNNIYIVAVNTGLRPGELFALTWDDIDIENKEIVISKTLVYNKFEGDDKKEFHIEPPKTKASNRKVPINKACELALMRQYVQKTIIARRSKRNLKHPDLLFTTKLNTPINAQIFNDSIKKILSEINLIRDELDIVELFSGHTFRHTFATRCIESGVKPKTLQVYLGHASLQMTMDLYVHVTDDTRHSEMTKFEEVIEKIIISESDIEDNYMNFVESNKESKSNIFNMDGVRVV